MIFMAGENHTVSALLAAGLVLSAIYLISSLSSNGPTAAVVAAPGMANILLASLIVVLSATALWYRTYYKV